MSSYVYMKILESQPKRYDLGIALLSLGQSQKVKKRIVADNINPGSKVLDIGCGTGTAAILAARAGAQVTGFDISMPMLDVAREKIAAASLADRIELIEMGISSMDRFVDASFDVVLSMLVFSELSSDEQAYTLDHAFRILRSGGLLVIADEVKPTAIGKKLFYSIVRIPLLIVTFVLTQTKTNAVEGLSERICHAGFLIEREERTALDSFLYLVARKKEE
jgi:ubiquinone/menaquinone biosynthesis C-methylase UbiE